jgi:hypothetical protein
VGSPGRAICGGRLWQNAEASRLKEVVEAAITRGFRGKLRDFYG